jgi:DNA-binding MarR family transcriptional regulator
MTKHTLSKKDFETLSDFRHQLRRFLRFSEEVSRQHGITHLQYQLLLHVMGQPGRPWATVGELAERMQSHHNGMVSLVSRCEKLGLVRRETGRKDKREVEVHLTPKGEKLLRTLASLHSDELHRMQRIFRVPDVIEAEAD